MSVYGFASEQVRDRVLASLNRSFETFYEHSVAVDRHGIINWISDNYSRFLGCTESPLGRHITDLIPGSYLPQVLATGKPVLLDLLQIRNQWTLVSVVPVHNEQGGIEGAFGFVATDSPSSGMKPLLERYNQMQREVREAMRYRDGRSARYQLSQIAGRSTAIKAVKQQIRQAARFDISVLLTGETGTGKELFAHSLHDLSDRADKPFVSVNVAAIPETLMESEFFGVAAGAFTGAKKEGRPGKIEVAGDGTLFLDEIGDMPLALQSKLLRVLQEREFERVGSNQVQTTRVRIVAATSRDLEQMVAEGSFRPDLYYRLNAMPIRLPSLRERLDDIEPLSEKILDDCCSRLGVCAKSLTDGAIRLLQSYHWPGNVRELYNVLERACILNEQASQIDAAQLVAMVQPVPLGQEAGRGAEANKAPDPQPDMTLKQRMKLEEMRIIQETLQLCDGNRTEAANRLGISRAALYNKLKMEG
ncbi:sigma 54-interacting transcriptional regulator [Marinobacterium sp. AK62]|uniref:Sigma 54-interacting transcriptional regulator n=1 Tax=Marinobacterium alkalitolerans TaxID=1542925 RepID=A0ABS3Z7C1_9GAMM|nr:sigma 54-interacting transcriptional regulator [Marinobacterium alkalitolerans]MBP0047583.1 sigma 54-interacting transcriptional regulator [Marinobacterium alkalitolerans]